MEKLGEGLAWMGFWIGLGLYNFQGCTPQVQKGIEIYREGKPVEQASLGDYKIRRR